MRAKTAAAASAGMNQELQAANGHTQHKNYTNLIHAIHAIDGDSVFDIIVIIVVRIIRGSSSGSSAEFLQSCFNSANDVGIKQKGWVNETTIISIIIPITNTATHSCSS